MSKQIASQILSVTGPGRTIHAGAVSSELLTELLLSGCDAWAISDRAGIHPRWLQRGDCRMLDADTVVYELSAESPYLFEVNTRDAPRNLVLLGASLDRKTIENLLFAAGWRRHPGGLQVHDYASLTDGRLLPLSFYQRIPKEAAKRWPVRTLEADRNLHMDMLRESGPRADAHLVRYALATQYVRPGDRVLDCACGLGYGTAMLASLSRGGYFLGVDVDEATIDYATANYARPGVRFKAGDAANLSDIPDNSIDLVVSFETVEHVEDWQGALAEFARVLRPDGRIIASVPDLWVDETGRDPNPYHYHAFDWPKFADGLRRHFILEKRYAQTAPGGFKLWQATRALEPVPLDWAGDAEWLIAVASADPLKADAKAEFTHPGFCAALAASHSAIVDFARFYDNPYLYRPMVQMGERLNHDEELVRLAQTVATSSRSGSADQGAAFCVLGYRALEQRDVSDAQLSIERALAYKAQTDSSPDCKELNPHVLRWRLSLFYLSGRLAEMLGDTEGALRWLRLAAETDWSGFSPLIATKVVGACFHAGLLSLIRNDAEAARTCFKRGVEQSLLAARADAREIIGSLDEPLPFGLQELAEVIDMGSQCANAVVNLARWERDRGAFWRSVDVRRFGLATWARELEQANTLLGKRSAEQQHTTAQAISLCQTMALQLKQLMAEKAELASQLEAYRVTPLSAYVQ